MNERLDGTCYLSIVDLWNFTKYVLVMARLTISTHIICTDYAGSRLSEERIVKYICT